LRASYGNPARAQYDFEARPHQQAVASSGAVPTIGGLWEIPNDSQKVNTRGVSSCGNRGRRLRRPFCEWMRHRNLTGTFKDGKVLLSHFSGRAHP